MIIPDAFDQDYCYDIETWPNCFLMTVQHLRTGWRWIYEISVYSNDSHGFTSMWYSLRDIKARMVGFNNLAFDYSVCHYAIDLFLQNGWIDPALVYERAQLVIAANNFDAPYSQRFKYSYWPSDMMVPQIDLLKIHHFDNRAKRTSLKVLQFNMRSPSVEDMPFPHSTWLTKEQIPIATEYNCHDVDETARLYEHSLPMIRQRQTLTEKFGMDFTNFNDTKIGKSFFIQQLEKRSPGICYTRKNGRKEPRQTWRSHIPLDAVIFPYVQFQHPELQRVHSYLKSVVLTETKEPLELKDLTATIDDFEIYFGAGGGHASLKNAAVYADQEHDLIDVDVKSYYPNIAIKNRVYPEHLTELFCDVYSDLYEMRAQYPKKSAESAMLKLANNGVYGDSNEDHSVFKDPAYTMTITINGQLLLCMLLEWQLRFNPAIRPIQLNTDGITFKVPKSDKPIFEQVCKAWEQFTLLTLEYTNYQSMFIRDVNNYIAVGTDGTVKRKGVYQYDTSEPNNIAVSLGWHQDWSALVVPKAAEAALVNRIDPRQFIFQHTDPYDFMIRERSTGQSRLALVFPDGTKQELSQTVRYHIAKAGPGLVKIMPPLARKVAENPDAPPRNIRVNKGWSVNICNRAERFDWHTLERSWYIEETNKLIKMGS